MDNRHDKNKFQKPSKYVQIGMVITAVVAAISLVAMFSSGMFF